MKSDTCNESRLPCKRLSIQEAINVGLDLDAMPPKHVIALVKPRPYRVEYKAVAINLR